MKTEMKPLQLPKVLKVEGSNCSNYINSHHLQFQFNMYELVKAGGGTELAKSALSPTTTIQLPTPVETDSIALQFRSMPKGQDGRDWAWISELTVQ